MDKIAYVDDNIKSIDLELTSADIENINAKMAQIQVQGRLPWRQPAVDVRVEVSNENLSTYRHQIANMR